MPSSQPGAGASQALELTDDGDEPLDVRPTPFDIDIGRACHRKVCRRGVRLSCDEFTCGVRPYLNDEFGAIAPTSDLLAQPPIVLWPKVSARVRTPADVELILSRPCARRSTRCRRTV